MGLMYWWCSKALTRVRNSLLSIMLDSTQSVLTNKEEEGREKGKKGRREGDESQEEVKDNYIQREDVRYAVKESEVHVCQCGYWALGSAEVEVAILVHCTKSYSTTQQQQTKC